MCCCTRASQSSSRNSFANFRFSRPTVPKSEWERRSMLRRALRWRLVCGLLVGAGVLVFVNYMAWNVGEGVLNQQLSVLLMASSAGVHHALAATLEETAVAAQMASSALAMGLPARQALDNACAARGCSCAAAVRQDAASAPPYVLAIRSDGIVLVRDNASQYCVAHAMAISQPLPSPATPSPSAPPLGGAHADVLEASAAHRMLPVRWRLEGCGGVPSHRSNTVCPSVVAAAQPPQAWAAEATSSVALVPPLQPLRAAMARLRRTFLESRSAYGAAGSEGCTQLLVLAVSPAGNCHTLLASHGNAASVPAAGICEALAASAHVTQLSRLTGISDSDRGRVLDAAVEALLRNGSCALSDSNDRWQQPVLASVGTVGCRGAVRRAPCVWTREDVCDARASHAPPCRRLQVLPRVGASYAR